MSGYGQTGEACYCGHREGRHWGKGGRCVDCQCDRFERRKPETDRDWWSMVRG